MASASPVPDRADPRDRRLLGFLLLSLLLHVFWLALPLSRKGSSTFPHPTLAVHLAQPRAPHDAASERPLSKPVESARGSHQRAQRASTPGAEPSAQAERDPALPPERQGASINLETAFAAARSIARDMQPTPNTIGTPTLPLTVETAVAKATRPDVVVESRGAEGEWVTRQGKMRCVARLRRKPFEEGVPMLPLCEVRKG